MAVYSGPGFVSYDGRPCLQSDSVSLDVQTDNKDVNTLLLGRAGHSGGPKKIMCSVSQAIPMAGPEFDWVGIANAQAEVPLSFTLAGRTYNCRGDVRSVKLDSGVDSANKVSFEFHGIIVGTV